MSEAGKIRIDELIEIVKSGGAVKTGIDVFNEHGVLLLEKDVVVKDVKPLQIVRDAGIKRVPINALGSGGLWDAEGNRVVFSGPMPRETPDAMPALTGSIGERIEKINETKKLAAEKHQHAKVCIRKVIEEIKNTGGEFDFQAVESVVSELIDFLVAHENGFSYLTREILSYDDYLYNHSINVCTIAAAALHKFNKSFSNAVNMFLSGLSFETLLFKDENPAEAFALFNDEEVRNIAIGFFLHDVGKTAIPDHVINKKGPLDSEEYDLVKLHSFDKGQEILEKSGIHDTFIKNVIKFHHCSLFRGESGCYPKDLAPAQVPPYVKICKLADMYDAMTSKRCYKDALNPISVVTELFRKYANKDRLLQFIVDSFIRTVGIYPAGSIVKLRNGQKAFIIDSRGPIVVPFTSKEGTPFTIMKDPVNIEDVEKRNPEFGIDRHATLSSPVEEYKFLPKYLQISGKIISAG